MCAHECFTFYVHRRSSLYYLVYQVYSAHLFRFLHYLSSCPKYIFFQSELTSSVCCAPLNRTISWSFVDRVLLSGVVKKKYKRQQFVLDMNCLNYGCCLMLQARQQDQTPYTIITIILLHSWKYCTPFNGIVNLRFICMICMCTNVSMHVCVGLSLSLYLYLMFTLKVTPFFYHMVVWLSR